jgi:metal-responsive CopG/Arc/MetJ family transcriptional regulator
MGESSATGMPWMFVRVVTRPSDTIWPMARTQTLVQLTEDLLRQLDERAAREGRSRSALIRDAIEAYLYDEEKARIDREIVEGYERIPITDEEMAIAERETREMIREEPW